MFVLKFSGIQIDFKSLLIWIKRGQYNSNVFLNFLYKPAFDILGLDKIEKSYLGLSIYLTWSLDGFLIHTTKVRLNWCLLYERKRGGKDKGSHRILMLSAYPALHFFKTANKKTGL